MSIAAFLAGPTETDPDLDGVWRVNPQVAMRPEPFGALLYHFGTRRLSFLKDPALCRILQSLDGTLTLREGCSRAGVPAEPGSALREADR